jgi:pyruvate/2-oxoglutarate dehydrogenase complex dihydrolipoamide dehydrogenase (E3) component
VTTKERYDAIVIGAGQAGGSLSTPLARARWKTVLVEREHVGGTCVNEGYTPTKTMVASAQVAYLARRVDDYGVQTGPVTVDMTRVRQRKRGIVESSRSGSQRRIECTKGLDLLMGEASFTGPKSVEVRALSAAERLMNSSETHLLTADKIFINLKIGEYNDRD